MLNSGPTVLTAAGCLAGAAAQESYSLDHRLANESVPGAKNSELEAQKPNSVWSPETDNGGVPPFKYSFALSRKRVESGGWTRQVTVRELPISKDIAGVEMRLTAGDILRNGQRSEEHTSELQSPDHLVCRLLLEKKKLLQGTELVMHFFDLRTPRRM